MCSKQYIPVIEVVRCYTNVLHTNNTSTATNKLRVYVTPTVLYIWTMYMHKSIETIPYVS